MVCGPEDQRRTSPGVALVRAPLLGQAVKPVSRFRACSFEFPFSNFDFHLQLQLVSGYDASSLRR